MITKLSEGLTLCQLTSPRPLMQPRRYFEMLLLANVIVLREERFTQYPDKTWVGHRKFRAREARCSELLVVLIATHYYLRSLPPLLG